MKLEQFVNEVVKTYDRDLESIILFGSAATEDFRKDYSDHNIIIVLKQIAPAELQKANKLVKKWVKKGNPVPLFFDHNHIKTSADIFPIEFYDIKSHKKVLYGSDPFADIKIDNVNLRHQCESELKGKILQLQSRYVFVCHKDKEISKLMMDSLSAFLSIFKGLVRLLGHEPEAKKRALVEQLGSKIDFSPNVFMELLDIRDGNAVSPRKGASEKFEDYLDQLRIITDFVDTYGAS